MMQSRRPKWDFKDMTESEFRRIYQRARIVSVTAKMELTGADTTREWLVALDGNNDTFVVPDSWRVAFIFVGSWSVPGLFGLNHTGKRMAERLREIDRWEQHNNQERAEYERLREKFGDL
jgi:hypothetical protein